MIKIPFKAYDNWAALPMPICLGLGFTLAGSGAVRWSQYEKYGLESDRGTKLMIIFGVILLILFVIFKILNWYIYEQEQEELECRIREERERERKRQIAKQKEQEQRRQERIAKEKEVNLDQLYTSLEDNINSLTYDEEQLTNDLELLNSSLQTGKELSEADSQRILSDLEAFSEELQMYTAMRELQILTLLAKSLENEEQTDEKITERIFHDEEY